MTEVAGDGDPTTVPESQVYPPCACHRCKRRTRPSATALPVRSGWCHWHGGPSGTARTINLIERASGPPYPQTACAPCREQRHLTVLADRVPGELLWSV
ncbi:hypothetical protein ACWF94_12185 [Streptomyces sp. NPDC055078]